LYSHIDTFTYRGQSRRKLIKVNSLEEVEEAKEEKEKEEKEKEEELL